MAGESGLVTEVTQQERDRVLVPVQMVGFPPGFRLRSGEKVVLVNGEAGPAAMPLVRAVTVQNLTEEEGFLVADGQRFAVQESTVRAEGVAGGSGRHVIWVVETDAEGPKQVVAIRPER